jgi:hypothetical protein
LAELRPAGANIVIVPFAQRRALLQQWASAVRGFTALDFDCTLPALLSSEPAEGATVLMERGSVLSALKEVYSLGTIDGPLVVNSLGTLRAMAKEAGGERDWGRRLLKYVIYLAVAGEAKTRSTLFLLNSFRDGRGSYLLGTGWMKVCSGALDGVWLLTEDGLSRLS